MSTAWVVRVGKYYLGGRAGSVEDPALLLTPKIESAALLDRERATRLCRALAIELGAPCFAREVPVDEVPPIGGAK